MKILVYQHTGAGADAIAALTRAGHQACERNAAYFNRLEIEKCDTVLIVDARRRFEIVDAYTARGIPAFTLDFGPTELPGYPCAAFLPEQIKDPAQWDFIAQPVPNVLTNPPQDRMICSFYTAAPLELGKNTPTFERPRDITDCFHGESLKDAPRVWIVGGGPSLKGFDWDLLHGEVVIGANRAFEQPNVGIVVTEDDNFQRRVRGGDLGQAARERWSDFPGIRVFAACYKSNPIGDGIHVVRRAARDEPDVDRPTLENIGRSSNSGFAALKLAWAMGAKRIYCLGFDMAGENGEQAWFHSGYPTKHGARVYDEYRLEMDAAAPRLEADGVRVTICGPTALTAFPTITMAEAAGLLSTKPLRPVVCGFYTRGTRYKEEAEAMARSAVAFGLDVSIVDVENLGDWKANTDQKPEAIRYALQKLDRPIAFVDADARFKAYPALFDAFAEGDSELALSYFDWDAFPADPRKGRELSSAVMLLKNTTPVWALLDTWIRALANSGRTWEQRVLQDILSNYAGATLKTVELPMRYNQIFDSMSSLGLPVIEQMQASRRLKEAV